LYRVLYFAWKNFGSVDVGNVDAEVMQRIKETRDKIVRALQEWEFKVASDAFMELAGFGNLYFQNAKPWELIKENKEECMKVIANCLQLAKALIVFSYPVMPKTMEKMAGCIGLNVREAKFEDVLIPLGKVELKKPEVPFEKVDEKKVEEMERIMVERIRRAEMAEKEEKKEIIDIEEFKRLDIKIGKILKAEKIKGSDKLLRLEVDVGNEIRQLVAGIAEVYRPEDVVGKLVPVLVNLKPAKIRGVESQGMILAADVDGKPVLLHPEKDVPPGSKVR